MWQVGLLASITSLAVTQLTQKIIYAINGEVNAGFLLVLWIILSLFLAKASVSHVRQMVINLILKPLGHSARLSIHKISLIKQARKLHKSPCNFNNNYELSYLTYNTINKHIGIALCLNENFMSTEEYDIKDKMFANRAFMHFLEALNSKFPRNKLIKLYLIHFYTKKFRFHWKALKLINELQNYSKGYRLVNVQLLIQQAQNSIKAEHSQETHTGLDLCKFVESQGVFAQIKEGMLQQAEKQMALCQEISKGSSDLGKITTYGQLIANDRSSITRKIKLFLQDTPEYYVEPFLLFAQYHSKLNHSISELRAYRRYYNQKCLKYEKYFKTKDLVKQNLYQDINALIIISGRKNDAGNIIYCSKSIETMLGGGINFYVGNHISSLALPSLQSFYATLFKDTIENGNTSFLNTKNSFYGIHADGYLVETEMVMSIHPSIAKGLYFNIVLRPTTSNHEILLINRKGNVECASSKLGHQLNILRPRYPANKDALNIRTVSRELEIANESFNIIAANPESLFEAKNPDYEQNFYSPTISGLSPNSNALSEINSFSPTQYAVSRRSRRIKISLNEAREIYLSYTNEGKDVVLKQINKEKDRHASDADDKVYPYNCLISNQIYDKTLLRMITLQEIQLSEKNGSIIESYTTKEGYSPLRIVPKNLNQPEGPDSEDSDYFKSEKENQEGWIDFQKLDFDHPPTITSPSLAPRNQLTYLNPNVPSESIQTLEGNLLSPLSVGKPLLTSNMDIPVHTQSELFKSQDMTPKARGKLSKGVDLISKPFRLKQKLKEIKRLDRRVSNSTKDKEGEFGRGVKPHLRVQMSVATSQLSRVSHNKKISSAFKTALDVKFHPKYITVLTFLFYAVMAFIIVSYVTTKVVLDSDYDSLRAKKNILNDAQNRSFTLTNVESVGRIVLERGMGRLSMRDLGLLALPLPYNIAIVQSSVSQLSEINRNLIKSTSSLDKAGRRQLYQTDVKVFDTDYDDTVQSYLLLNNFAAIDLVVERTLSICIQSYISVPSVWREYHWIFRNSMNDLLIKDEEVALIFFNSIEIQKDQILSTVTLNLVITFSLLGVLAMTLCIAIIYLYQEEKRNMVAITKINTNDLYIQINEFRRMLECGKLFEDENFTQRLEHSKILTKRGGDKKIEKRESLYNFNYQTIKNKYFFYMGKICLFMAVIIGITSYSYLTVKDSITNLTLNQNQLYYINWMRIRTGLSIVLAQELLANDPLQTVENVPLLDKVNENIEELATITDKVTKVLLKRDGSYDPTLELVLFRDGCEVLNPSALQVLLCNALKSRGIKPTFVQLLTSFRSIFSNKVEQYMHSDKSSDALRGIKIDSYDTFLAISYTITFQANLMSRIINDYFEAELTSSLSNRSTSLNLLIIFVILISVAAWVLIFRPMRNLHTQFKQILQALPPDLVLANHLLKSYLLKTSKGALDFVRNGI